MVNSTAQYTFFFFFFLIIRPPPRSPLFPSTPLSRSPFTPIPNDFTRRWCLEAGALIVLMSDRQASPGKHSFDAGCAWGYLAMEAHAMGLATHAMGDRKSTRLNSSHLVISYAVFCLKKKKNNVSYTAHAH